VIRSQRRMHFGCRRLIVAEALRHVIQHQDGDVLECSKGQLRVSLRLRTMSDK
jgi:hypothetical protein